MYLNEVNGTWLTVKIRWRKELTMPFFFVYVLRSQKDGKFYIGLSDAVERRYLQHQMGMNTSTYCRRPFTLVHYEAFISKRDAERRERYFKTAKGKTTLKQMLRNYLKLDTNHNVPGYPVPLLAIARRVRGGGSI